MDTRDRSSEREWICRSQRGDKEAFGHVVKKYMRQAYYAALGILGSHEDALDASQEAFVRAFLSIERFDANKQFYTWYYRILRNHCLNVVRNKRIRAVSFSQIFDESFEAVSSDPSSEEVIQRRELKRAVWEGLWKLKVDDREILVARDILGTPYETLAELLECPVGTVMSRLYHARRRLRAELEGVV
jgi:RNA polymerase sigma-70 factor (ECF subfamily)